MDTITKSTPPIEHIAKRAQKIFKDISWEVRWRFTYKQIFTMSFHIVYETLKHANNLSFDYTTFKALRQLVIKDLDRYETLLDAIASGNTDVHDLKHKYQLIKPESLRALIKNKPITNENRQVDHNAISNYILDRYDPKNMTPNDVNDVINSFRINMTDYYNIINALAGA